jgi:hypothetical protein
VRGQRLHSGRQSLRLDRLGDVVVGPPASRFAVSLSTLESEVNIRMRTLCAR